jgi:hypothetical protein
VKLAVRCEGRREQPEQRGIPAGGGGLELEVERLVGQRGRVVQLVDTLLELANALVDGCLFALDLGLETADLELRPLAAIALRLTRTGAVAQLVTPAWADGVPLLGSDLQAVVSASGRVSFTFVQTEKEPQTMKTSQTMIRKCGMVIHFFRCGSFPVIYSVFTPERALNLKINPKNRTSARMNQNPVKAAMSQIRLSISAA